MSELNYVYEIGSCPDQEARGRALKEAVERQWPGSTVELRPHPMGGLRARIALVDNDAAEAFRSQTDICLIAEGLRLFAGGSGRPDL